MKKVKQIPPIYKDIETSLWWEYREFQKSEIDQLEEWFKKNHKDLQLAQDLFENMQYLFKTLGVHPHPVFRELPEYLKEKEIEKHFNNEMNNVEPEPEKDNNKYILINNQRIDYLTIRLLQQVWTTQPAFTVLKFCNNNISDHVNQTVQQFLLNPANKIVKLFYEWNPIQSLEYSQQFFSKFGQSTTIEFLVLRSNQITDDTFIALINAMEANQSCNIKYLEMYDNQIGQQSLDRLAQFMDNYYKFEYLGFAKNNINGHQEIQELLKRIGKDKMTEQMQEAHAQKEKEREELIAKWIKVKKKYTEDMLPKLDTIVQLIDGSPAIMRNPQLQMLNLSMNNLSDIDLDYFIKFQHMFTDEFQLVLWQNQFENKAKDKLRKKLQKNVAV